MNKQRVPTILSVAILALASGALLGCPDQTMQAPRDQDSDAKSVSGAIGSDERDADKETTTLVDEEQ